MDSTASELLRKIASNLEPLKNLNQNQFSFIPEIITAFLSIGVALIVAYLIQPWNRWVQKSNVEAIKVIRNFQQYQYLYRLQIVNDSNYIARNVQIDIEDIVESTNSRNIIPAPMRWTHGDTKPKDILPHQTVYLDLIEVKQEQGRFIKLTAPNIMDLDEMSVLNKGISILYFRQYQENGQTREFKLKIEWNGKEIFDTKLINLPIINLEL